MTVPARGWYVEIDDPETGHTWTPDVVGQPEIKPAVNTFPKVSIPVRRSERWLNERFEGAPMRVWHDGERQPIDQFEEPVETEERFALNGRGGVELDQRVTKEVDQQEAHLVIEDIIKNNTSYTANVDRPDADVQTNESIQQADTNSEWSSAVSIDDTTPAFIDGGRLKLAQSGFFAEAEDFASDGSTQSNTDASAGEEQFYSIGGDSYDFNLDYTIPESEVGFAIRYRIPSGSTQAEITFEIDGQTVETIGAGIFDNDTFKWFDSNFWDNGDLTAGSHSGGFDIGTDGEDIIIDCVHVYDRRHSTTFDNSVNSDGYLSGPELYPNRVDVETADAATAFQFTGARLESVWDDTSTNQRVGVSNDQGDSYTYADNSGTVETDFASGSPNIRGELGLSRYGSRSTATPTTGFQGQSVDLYELFGDIDETPLLVNQDYNDSVMNVVRDICEQADLISEYRKTAGSPSVEVTTPGQRSSSTDADVSGYRYSRSIEDRVKRVVIRGGRQRQRGEEFTADYGTAVELANGNIDRGTEAVYDPSTGESLIEGEDYKLTPGIESGTGTITALSGGSMTDGETYAIDYNYHNEGVATSDGAGSNPDTLVRELPAVTAQRGCEQAATILLRQLEDPLEEATVTVPAAAGFNVVDAQQFGPLPSDRDWEIRQITTNPGETEFALGTRATIDEITRRIQRRLSAAASRT